MAVWLSSKAFSRPYSSDTIASHIALSVAFAYLAVWVIQECPISCWTILKFTPASTKRNRTIVNNSEMKDAIKEILTPADVDMAQQMASRCLQSGYTDCWMLPAQ